MSTSTVIKEVTVATGIVLRASLEHGEVIFSLLKGDQVLSQSVNPAVAAALVAMSTRKA